MRIKIGLLALIALCLSGCTSFWCGNFGCRHHETHNSSSLVQFLYPNAEAPHEDGIPQLKLPLKVGLAFLPSAGFSSLNAAQKEVIMEKVRERFASRKFIADIIIIPDYYLRSAGGFQGLEGVQRLYGVDLMALISYDQVSHLNDNNLTFTYLTVVGAYIFNGSRDEVSTLVDLAVVDPKTRSLVIRAGGVDNRANATNLIKQDERMRRDEVDGFTAASLQMIDHFDTALVKFEADVREGRANVKVAQRSSASNASGGGGGVDGWLLAFLSAMALSRPALSMSARSGAVLKLARRSAPGVAWRFSRNRRSSTPWNDPASPH